MPAAAVAFDVVFGLFVVAFAVLAVITVTWAVRRDRAGRTAWASRREPDQDLDDGRVAPPMPPVPPIPPAPPASNGHRPRGRHGAQSEHSD